MPNRKEPKPYTLKTRRGDRPYSYSTEYAAWRNAVADPRAGPEDVRRAAAAWARRWGMHRVETPVARPASYLFGWR